MSANPRCRLCGGRIPPKRAPAGRPREFCSRQHRRQWHVAKEKLDRLIEVREARIEEAYARELQWHGKREADRGDRIRRKELEATIARWTEELWTPAPPPRPR